MRIVVFLGPTLSTGEASLHLEATYLPPAAQGDVYRAAAEQPLAIGIVDGYFERMPAIWHKELLWALARGIHVLGAASMGALRAAELAPFGMRGIGEIYRAFRSGELEDDDEVAITHGDEGTGYQGTSEAMVNMRATLSAAEHAGMIRPETRAELEVMAKAMFYPDRAYPRLLSTAAESGLPICEIDALRTFIMHGRVDQKRADAIALLDALRAIHVTGIKPEPARFSFSHTDAWDQLVRG